MLLNIANLPPEQRPYLCGWVCGDGVVCNQPVPGEQFPAHLREQHEVVGGDKTKMTCNWYGCESKMNKESVARHVSETHLGFRFNCHICGGVFTRKNTLNGHLKKH
ncbi:hypothetical protein ID866_9336 [Astraeus odoratus]|nr:hypothetical protein ID866_9336 [Astraeus odoratus]